LRTKATDHDLFTSLVRTPTRLPGTTPRADAALCTGDLPGAEELYAARLGTDADDITAWAGLGLAIRAQGREATALLEHPEITIAVHHAVRALDGRPPDPVALARWLNSAF
jgi:hypothetical protein